MKRPKPTPKKMSVAGKRPFSKGGRVGQCKKS